MKLDDEAAASGSKFLKKIKTSILFEDGTYLRCIIIPPCLEYNIESDNCNFIKYLDLSEVQMFTQVYFDNWHEMALKILG